MRFTFPKLCRFPKSLSTSATTHCLLDTKKAHARILKSGFPIRRSLLVQSYLNCEALQSARQVFDETSTWDLVSATSIISSFARRGCHQDAVHLFSRVLLLGIGPNQFTFSTVLFAVTAVRDHNVGQQLHARVTKMGFAADVFVGSSLLDHYVKLGSVEEAEKVFAEIREPNVISYTTLLSGFLKSERFDDALSLFQRMPERNVVSWNAMIGDCSKMGLNEESMNLFIDMCREGVGPTQLTFPSVFTAAANMAVLGLGRSIHAASIKSLNNPNVYVGSSLISFYAKCGCLEDSILVFDRLQEKNIVSWNAVICGYAQNGRGREALEFYRKMQSSCVKPNEVTLLGVLFGCNHAGGMVDYGYACFKQARMKDPGILRAEHYACVVSLLSRAGRFSEAEKFILELPCDPGVGFWKALVLGCQIHSNDELASAIVKKIKALNPTDASSYVLLSNVYSAAGSWQRTSVIRQEMKDRGMGIIPGCSWIEIGNKVHVFFNRDRRHDQSDDIYMVLRWLLTN